MASLTGDAERMNLARPPHLLARHDAGRIALEAAGSSLTYGDFDRLTGRISGRLRRSGIRRGDIAALVVRDDAVHLAAMFAIWRLGAVMLSLDWRSSPPEIRQILTRFAPARLIAAAMPMREAVESISLAGLEAETEVDPCIEPLDDAPAIYALSSGTTGLPKAAVITHAQQYARTMSYAVSYPVLRDDRYMSTVPLAYSWGRNMALAHLSIGARIILHPTVFGPQDLLAAVALHQPTTLAVVPRMSRTLLDLPPKPGWLMPGLRAYFSSSAPLPAQDRRELRARVSPNLVDAYGTTESGVATVLDAADMDRMPSAVGRPVFGIEVEVVDAEDRPLAGGETGRLRIRGPGVAKAYAGATGEDEARLAGGWF